VTASPSTDDIRTSLFTGQAIPCVIEPQGTAGDLAAWAAGNQKRVEELLHQHGALLFRGFRVEADGGFGRFAQSVGDGALEYTQRSTRRTKEAEGIYTSTEYPAPLTIELHSENAFQRSWPQRIMFHAVVVAETQGATPIADTAAIYDEIDAAVRDEFVARGITYVRNFGAGLELPWQEAFQTDQRADVEAYCQRNEMTWEWKDNDRLRTDQVLPAAIHVPALGRNVWFNQAHLFHPTNLGADIRAAMLETMDEGDLPRHAYFGDGGTIPDDHMAEVRRAYEACKTRFSWQRDDVMLLDNLRMCHGREPFTGARKVLVSMSNPAGYDDFPLLPAGSGPAAQDA
jgi:hypothetical protein